MRRRLRRRYGRAVHKPFVVSKTYDVTTPESAEVGDYEDSGFDFEPEPMTLREVVYEVKKLGAIDSAEAYGGNMSLYESDGDVNYRTGAETRHALHVRAPENALRRLKEVLKDKGVRFQR